MGLLEFSWATITLIDIGVLSISGIGLWWLKNQVDRYKALSEELSKQYNTLQQEHTILQQEHATSQQAHENLQQEFRNFQRTADRRYNVLLQESETRYNTLQKELETRYNTLQEEWMERYNTLQEEHDTLKAETAIFKTGLETVTQEHKILERKYDTMAGRYQEISDKFTLILEKLADRN